MRGEELNSHGVVPAHNFGSVLPTLGFARDNDAHVYASRRIVLLLPLFSPLLFLPSLMLSLSLPFTFSVVLIAIRLR